MRKASAPMLFLVGLLVAAVIGGVTFGVAALAGVGDDDDGGGDDTATTVEGGAALNPDQVSVSGVAVSIAVVGAVFDELALPVVTTPSAGLGAGARFEAALVDGEDSAIVWDAGRPLLFDAATPLRIDPAPVGLLANMTAMIVAFTDDDVHRVLPGDYEIDAPVAVSTGGLATSHDAITFTADDGTTVSFTGSAAATLAAAPLEVTGPGRVVLEGALRVTRPDGTVLDVSRIELPSGSFRLAATPRSDGTGFDLTDVLLEGAVVTA